MVSAPIDRVRVYSQGATVVRTVTLKAPLPETLEVPGLPLSLVDTTVRVRSLDDAVVAGAVQIGLFAPAPDDLPEPPEASALREVERRIEALGVQLTSIDAEMELLRGLEVPERPEGEEGKPPPPSPMRARVALEQFSDTAIQERLTEARELRRELVRKNEEAEALRDAIRRASMARTARSSAVTKTVLVDLSGTADQVDIEVEYFIPGARWAPQYQCDIAKDGSGASLKLRALVCQASGEDWKDVALELSTAAPHSFTELPELSSIRIGKAQPAPASRGYREPPRGAASLYGDYDRERTRTRSLMPRRTRIQAPSLDVPSFSSAAELMTYGGFAVGAAAPAEFEAEDLATESIALSALPAGGGGAVDAMRSRGPGAPPPPAPKMQAPRRRKGGKMKKRAPRREAAAMDIDMDDEALEIEEEEDGFGGGGAPSVSFSRLRLASARSGQRGTLRNAEPGAEYLRLLKRSGLEVTFDVLSVVRAANRHAASAANQPLPGGAVQVRDAAGYFDYAYTADDRVDVPSDLAFHSVPLGLREAECEVTYVVVPRVDTNVFRVASIHNPTQAPLLPGPAEVYVGGEYVLSTTLPTVAPGERFKLGLGVEQGIRCARNTRFREERAGKNVVAMAELHHEIDIELNNQLGRTIQCEVRERIPQPDKDAEVDVEELAVTPDWTSWDQVELGHKLEGGRKWVVHVDSHASAELSAHYVVKIYANNEVVGGNRREA